MKNWQGTFTRHWWQWETQRRNQGGRQVRHKKLNHYKQQFLLPHRHYCLLLFSFCGEKNDNLREKYQLAGLKLICCLWSHIVISLSAYFNQLNVVLFVFCDHLPISYHENPFVFDCYIYWRGVLKYCVFNVNTESRLESIFIFT